MPDVVDDGLDEAFKGFGEDPTSVTPKADDPGTPPAKPGAAAEPPKEEPKPADEPKKPETPDQKTTPAEQPPATDDKEKKEEPKPPETPESPAPGTPEKPEEPKAPEEPKPLTKDDVQEVVTNLLTNERASGKELETATNEVLESYYPDGLSNVLIDERTGKELRTPQDVVDASGGEMSTEQAAQWLMNEEFKLNQSINKIKDDARKIAETTLNFKRDSMTVLQKYEPLFKWQPALQKKAFDLMMKQVKVDKERNVILSAPDVMDLYDTYLEPWQSAYEFSTKQSSTAPTPNPNEPPKPSAEDRMDEGGDGGPAPVNDPNDFGQQVVKELAKPL